MCKLGSVQVLRGVAASGVVVFHATGAGFATVAAGVDLFFVISGFIMATIGPGKQPLRFLGDRVIRIFPLWLVAVAPWLLVLHPTLPKLLVSLTLWPIYGGQFYWPVLGVGWTLSFECLFYAAFALARYTRAAVPLALFALFLVTGVLGGGGTFGYLGSPISIEFLLGILIAKLPRMPRAAAPMAVMGLVVLTLSPDLSA